MASINLEAQPSESNQNSGERNQVIPPVHGPQRAPIARDLSQTLTQSKYGEHEKKTDVKKTGLHGSLQSFRQLIAETNCHQTKVNLQSQFI